MRGRPLAGLLCDTKQHSQQTEIHAPHGTWNHNPNLRKATDPHLRRCNHHKWTRIESLLPDSACTILIIYLWVHILKPFQLFSDCMSICSIYCGAEIIITWVVLSVAIHQGVQASCCWGQVCCIQAKHRCTYMKKASQCNIFSLVPCPHKFDRYMYVHIQIWRLL